MTVEAQAGRHVGLLHGAALLLVVVVFVVSLGMPRSFCEGLLYSLPIMVACLTGDRRFVVAITVSGIVLNVVGYFVSSPASQDSYAGLNRFAASIMLIVMGALATMAVRRFELMAEANAAATALTRDLQRTERLLQVGGRMARLGGWAYDVLADRLEWGDEVAAIHDFPSEVAPSVEEAMSAYAPGSRERVEHAFQTCLHDGVPYDQLFEILPANGRRKWVRSIGEPVRDQTGRIIRVQGALQDVTELRLLRKSLKASQARFRELADAMPLLVWTALPNGSVDYSNRAVFVYTGRENLELASIEWSEVIHPDDLSTIRAYWSAGIAAGREFSVEFRIWRAIDAAWRWHSVTGTPIRDQSGTVVKWYGTAIDIDDNKRDRDDLGRLSRRLLSTLESITDGFYIVDHDWHLTYINAEFARWLDRPKGDLIGQQMWALWPHLAGTAIEHQFQAVMATHEPADFIQYFEGVHRWVRVRAYPSEEGLMAYLEDITAQRELEEKQRQSHRLEAIGQLTGGIAHDFNNLLTVILGNTEALVESLNDPDQREAADLATRAAERGAELTSRLLSFARRQPLDPRPTDINELVLSMGDLLRRTLGEDIGLHLLLRRPDLWHAAVDPSQFENALLNLCINARDAMPFGGSITIATDNVRLDDGYAREEEVLPGTYVMLSVTDTGSGMSRDVIDRAFEPFFTTKPVGQGSGLGLSMVFGFSKQSRGHVKIVSAPGRGTTVKLYLPRAAEGDAPAAIERPRKHAVPSGSERILLVEDDDMVRKHVARQLTRLGYQVVTAANGPEAMLILQHDKDLDLMFTDIVMPGGMTGHDLADRARQTRPGLRVLFTSGYAEDSGVDSDHLDPGVDILRKPYRRQELAAKLREVLDADRA